ncbi:MAG: type II toxin-antitoxin system RelE/ParE family toxin [Sphingomonadales bacterium]
MSNFKLLPAARADLRGIWLYSSKQWSRAQADGYIGSINEAIRDLAAGRLMSRPIDGIRPGYRKMSVGSHFIVFRQQDSNSIVVVRILHQRMDLLAHLRDEP